MKKHNTQFRKDLLSKLSTGDVNLTFAQAVILWYNSRTRNNNISSGQMAKYLDIPCDQKSIDIFNNICIQKPVSAQFLERLKDESVRNLTQALGAFSISNYVSIIGNPTAYDKESVKRYSKEKFEQIYGESFDYFFKSI